MNNPRFTPEFKEEAVRQVVERGYSVAEVGEVQLKEIHKKIHNFSGTPG